MSGNSKPSRRDNKDETPIMKIIIGSILATVMYFAVIAVYAAFALNSVMSVSTYMPAGMIVGAITGFLGGFVSVRPLKEKGLLYGLISGAIQAIICSVVLFIVNGGTAGNGIFILCALIVLFSVLGGISAVNLKMKKKY